jgi:hypothetical protein
MKSLTCLLMANLLVMGCDAANVTPLTKAEALTIAGEYVAREDPNMVPIIRPNITDHGETWVVKYEIPEGWAGGAPTIEINKKTREIVSAVSGQ